MTVSININKYKIKFLCTTSANQIQQYINKKKLYTMTKWDLFYVHKAVSALKNQ